MKICIYNPQMHAGGGGERYIGTIAEHISKTNEIEFLLPYKLDKHDIEKRLNLDLSRVKFRFIEGLTESNLDNYIKEYDHFINSAYMSGYYSPTKNSSIIVFFPSFVKHDKPIWFYKVKYLILSRIFNNPYLSIKTMNALKKKIYQHYQYSFNFLRCKNYIKTYGKVISISEYTKYWVKKELEVDSEIIYPPVDVEAFQPGTKKDIIISVGRFFVGNHSKKQLELIKVFKQLYDSTNEIKKYTYHLCGGVDDKAENIEYLKQCKSEAKGYPIFIHENIAFSDLKKLYSESKIFWHATGLDEDIDKDPDKFEHFGITTVEAMSAGVIPVVIGKAGQVEIVKNGENGFLWNDRNELKVFTLKGIRDENLMQYISDRAKIGVDKFSKGKMYERIDEVLTFN